MDLGGGGEGVSVYAEAKGEYTRQLCQYMVPALHKYFLEMLEDAKVQEPEPKKVLLKFQQLLENISEWNVNKVQKETQAVAIQTQCDYLEELLTAVFIAHTKVLSAIRLTKRQKKLHITIPKLEHFLHRTLTECARLLWSNAYLYSASGTSLERQKNMRQIENHLTEGVLQAIRGMLPVKSILREYLKGDESEAEGEEEGEEEAEEEEEEAEAEASEPVAADLSGAEAPALTEREGSVGSELAAAATAPESPPHAPTPSTTPVSEAPPPAEGPATDAKPAATEAPAPPAPTGPAPTIIVDTAPQVDFTGLNQVFDSENPEDSGLEEMDDEEITGEIQILDAPAAPMDDFEDLDKPAAPAPPQPEPEDDGFEFEELS